MDAHYSSNPIRSFLSSHVVFSMNKKNDTMKQCHLMNLFGENYHCWLPTKFAIVGKILELKRNEEWSSHWIVREVWTELPTVVVRARERDYLETRKASDI